MDYLDLHIDHAEEKRSEIGALAVWSIGDWDTNRVTDWSKVSYRRMLTLIYTDYWPSEDQDEDVELRIDFKKPPTNEQLFKAADELIRKSGDDHHIYIEDFEWVEKGTYRLITGS